MANRRKIISNIIRGLQGGLVAHNAIAYLPGFAEVAQGILIEGTSSKDTVYVYHLRMPFLYPYERVHLNHSERFPSERDGTNLFFEGSDKTIAEAVIARVQDFGLWDEIQRPFTVDNFIALRRDPPPGSGYEVGYELENAIARYLAGRVTRARVDVEFIRQTLSNQDFLRNGAGEAYLRELDTVERLLPLLDGQPNAVVPRLRALVHENATRLGFVASPPGPR